MKYYPFKILAALAMVSVLLASFQCGKEGGLIEENLNAHHSGCLFYTDAGALNSKGSENPDMVSVEYDNGTLHVTHHNLAVNCGTAEIEGGITVTAIREGSTINIHEIEDENNPHSYCMCEVDNEFDICNIEHGTYTLVFYNWYPEPQTLTFTF